MLPLFLGLAGLAAGGVKSGIEAGNEKKDRQLQAETTRYSPWTGMQAEAPRRTDFLGNLLQGGLSGAMLGRNINQADAATSAATSGTGPVASGKEYGASLLERLLRQKNIGPVANGNLYSSMLQGSPVSPWEMGRV